MLMVQAGKAVDAVIDELLPLLSPGDLIIDGGNSFFKDTIRRTKKVEAAGLMYMGAGVSGGEEGALNGPSIMPGGTQEAWRAIGPIFRTICAKSGRRAVLRLCRGGRRRPLCKDDTQRH